MQDMQRNGRKDQIDIQFIVVGGNTEYDIADFYDVRIIFFQILNDRLRALMIILADQQYPDTVVFFGTAFDPKTDMNA